MAAVNAMILLAKDPVFRYYSQLESEILQAVDEGYDEALENVRMERAEYMAEKYGIRLHVNNVVLH